MRRTQITFGLALAGLFTSLAVLSVAATGCREPADEGGAAEAPLLPARRSAEGRVAPAREDYSVPVRTKVTPSPVDRVTIGTGYRGSGGGGGGGGGGGRSIERPPGLPRGMRLEAEEMHAEARDLASRPIRRGSEACDLAFEAMAQLRQAREKAANLRRRTADRDSFLDTCERLPEIEQWCMVPNYVRDNQEECDRRAHTRVRRAIAHYEDRADGEADDWAPAEDPVEAGETPSVPTLVDAD